MPAQADPENVTVILADAADDLMTWLRRAEGPARHRLHHDITERLEESYCSLESIDRPQASPHHGSSPDKCHPVGPG